MPTLSLLFVDQVSSTAQLHHLGDRAAAPLRRAFVEDLRACVEAAGGQEIEFGGDGLFASFGGAADALAAAVAMQQAVHAADAVAPEGVRLGIRVGVHTGEPIETEQGELFGIAVVVARRLCDLAGAGEILVSDLVRALLAPRREWSFEDRGAHELKGVGEPVLVAAATWTPMDLRGPAPIRGTVPEGLDPAARGRAAVWLLDAWRRTNGSQVAIIPGHPAAAVALDELSTVVHDEGGFVVDAAQGPTSLDGRLGAALTEQLRRLPVLVRHVLGLPLVREDTLVPVADALAALSRLGPVLVRCGTGDPSTDPSVVRRLLEDPRAQAAARVLLVIGGGAALTTVIPGTLAARVAVLDVATLTPPKAVSAPPPTRPVPSVAPRPVAVPEAPTTRVDAGELRTRLVFDDGREEPLRHLVTVIGRSPDATIRIVDTSVSRRHAEIRVVGGRAVIRDLGSTNGTTVNGRPVTEEVLADGDRVVLGSHPLTVRA